MLTRLKPILLVPPSWVPKADGVRASNFADYRTESGANRYWNNNTQWMSAQAWWNSRGTGATFSRASSAFGVPSTGLLTSYGSGIARRTVVDPSNTSKGLGGQYEGPRTNISQQSADLGNAYWSTVNGTTTSNVTVAPDGNTTAALFVPDATNSYHRINRNIGSLTNPWTTSIYVKSFGYTKVAIRGEFLTGDYATFLLSGAGSVITQSGGVGSIVAVVNGWYRISFTDTNVDNGVGFSVLSPSYVSGNPAAITWMGNGTDGVYWWGADTELASFLSSYIATTTTSVTRAADSQSLTRTAPTSITKVIAGRTPSSSASAIGYILSNSSNTNRMAELFYNGGNLSVVVFSGGVQTISLNLGALASNTDFVVALQVGGNAVAASLNGGAVMTGAGATPTNADTETEGAFTGAASLNWFSTIKGTGEWTNFAASNAALQALSGSSYWN